MEGQDERERKAKVAESDRTKTIQSTSSLVAGSRKKRSEAVFVHPNQENAESVSGSSAHAPQATSCDQPNVLLGVTHPEFQCFSSDIDFSSLMTVDTPSDVLAGLSGAFVSKPWLRPPYILSPPSEDDTGNGWKIYDSPASQVDAAANVGMGSVNHLSSNAAYSFTVAKCLNCPDSIPTTRKTKSSALSTMEAAQPYAVADRSAALHSAPAINEHGSKYPFQNANQNSQNKRRGLSASNPKRRGGCCMAHKAESMVLDLQKLYNYGLRFGFFEDEDDQVEDCLSFLRAKLKDMAQCPGGDAGFSSSSDSDVK